MTNGEIARIFERIAILLELDEANPFRVRAYREAARVIEAEHEAIAPRVAADPKVLEQMPGIGKDLAQKIRDVLATGTTKTYQDLTGKFPPGLIALTDISGFGPKRVKAVWSALGITTREALEQAAREGKLRALPGFGEKMEQKLLKSLEAQRPELGRTLLHVAWPIAHAFADRLKQVPGVAQVEIAGSFRRRRETIGDLDLLACCGNHEQVMEAFVTHPMVAEVAGRGETKSSVRLASGLQVDLRVVPPESFGAAAMYFTGSKAHNIELRRIALDNGMSLNEYGLTRDKKRVAGHTEAEIYQALGLPWIPPELREGMGEIEVARAGMLPKLIEQDDIRADLHIHTNRTDGREPLEVMVRAAKERGYAYCAITDHSKALAMSGGFDLARVKQSVKEIEKVRKQVPGIEVLHGLEVDILTDGSLDLEDEGLALLDWVIVSIHSRFDQPREVMTGRVMRAISHPLVCAMGHPSARQIGSRPPAAIDFEQVFARAAERGVAMEINSSPARIDLSDQNARLAKANGVTFVIDTDAHAVPEFDYMRYGVFAARRAGLTKADVLNTLPAAKFRAAARKLAASRA